MAKSAISMKRLAIDKSNANTIAVMAVSSFVVVFSLVATQALFSQRSYQSRVITEKQKALNQLRANNQAANELATSFQVFQAPAENIIGGSTTGNPAENDKNGDNAKIILDALPSKYDFPGLTTSLDKILSGKTFKVATITGQDDEVNQASQQGAEPIEIPFETSVSGSFDALQEALDTLQRSIRPIKLLRLELSGSNGEIGATISAKTYYQPEKRITITTKDVR